MNTKHLFRLAALSFAAALPLQSFAAGAGHFLSGQSIYGQPATAQVNATRVVDVSNTMRLAVRHGETVTFKAANGQQVTWTFNGLGNRAVPLAKLAPAAFAGSAGYVFVGRDLRGLS